MKDKMEKEMNKGFIDKMNEMAEDGTDLPEKKTNPVEEEADNSYIIGRNAVMEALKAGHGIECLYTQRPPYSGSLSQIVALAQRKKILVKEVSRPRLDEMAAGSNHQGVIASVQAFPYADIEDMFALAASRGESPFLVICESIQDPHNLGAILRSAEACGVHGVIISKRHAVGLTGAVTKTAAGAAEYVPVAKVNNIPQTIELLKKKGVWIASADMDGELAYSTNLTGSICMVIGGEHEGISRLVREKSDYIVQLPMRGKINSLNASVAAGALMYEIVRQRYYGKKG